MIQSLLIPTSTLAAAAAGGGEDPFQYLFGHVVPQVEIFGMHLPHLLGMQIWNIQVFQVFAVVLTVACFLGVRRAVVQGSGGPFTRMMAGFVTWIRDEMVHPNLGKKDGDRLLPLFLSMFFLILFMNLLGLVPFGLTATANIFVTAALATVTLVVMLIGGMMAQGPAKFWVNLVPGGVPWWLWPMLFVLEVAGLIIKPFALTMRLMANMTGGHLVILSFLGLMYYFGQGSSAIGFGVSPLIVGMSVFMMIIEGFVALLQAYVFTLLSIIFVGMSLHPDH